MTPTPTPAEIEDILLDILRANRPGMKVRGCRSHLEIHDREVQKRLLEPLLKARAEAGLIGPLDDLGHDTAFVAAWNRAICGESEDWDCRSLALPFVRAALQGVPDMLRKLFNYDAGPIKGALLRRLPDILAGGDFQRPATCAALKSRVTGDHVWFRVDGFLPAFCRKDGAAIESAPKLPAFFDVTVPDEAPALIGLIAFHGEGVTDDESQKAWEAWRAAEGEAGLDRYGLAESMAGSILRTRHSFRATGIFQVLLRQDESVSVEAGPDGFTLYRGSVAGLKRIVDEGLLLIGPRATFMKILVEGGFSKAGASDYLDRLAQTNSAFAATVPAGSSMRILVDPETLCGFDAPDPYEMFSHASTAEAIPIFAAGTFPMPEMVSHRERLARAREPEASTP
ncbi:hypothetical protein LAZ40_03150 [Cereibacter sphaeroides]|uniref:hypothetical protein n=1 Tax=Cereibacter sphaeroides TaxID=1063 RepID=UPI001F3CEFE2|nr:hypothetical protein [Cereibacter sphaeroides]MCE6958052.1 hypothetical protein [Cereibacter sphaeroides]MCE6971355.1 hypothetical protein [Cereibacter sphaeroides]